ncbi:MAG: redoxin domain-containing protein [Pseudomonadota bacterium]
MALKSLLLTPVILALTALSAFALVRIFGGAPILPWFGVLLAAAPLPGFVTTLMVAKPAGRTSRHLPVLLFLTSLGFALTLVAAPLAGTGPAAAAGAAALGFLWYDYVYSDLSRTPSDVLRQGEPLPRFTVYDLEGRAVPSSDFVGRRTLLLFFRGNWCPLCMAQVQELADRYRELSAMGVDVVLISPQPHRQTESLARKYDVDLRFLVDADGIAAKALEIYAPDGTPSGLTLFGYGKDTVLPTVIATEADGTILYLDQTDNYRVRPEPDVFLEIYRDGAPAATSSGPTGPLKEGTA